MCRKCQTNICPVGIATQDPERRVKFRSSADNVIRYWRFIAEDVRSMLVRMGFRSLDEIVGRTDLLRVKEISGKVSHLDLSRMLADIPDDRGATTGQNNILSRVFDCRIIGLW